MKKGSRPDIPFSQDKKGKSKENSLCGKALFHTTILQQKYYDQHSQVLSEIDSLNLLFEHMPSEIVRRAIIRIINSGKK